MTKTKEALVANRIAVTSSIQSKLICAAEAHKRVKHADIVYSIESIGLYPMGYRFRDMFNKKYV